MKKLLILIATVFPMLASCQTYPVYPAQPYTPPSYYSRPTIRMYQWTARWGGPYVVITNNSTYQTWQCTYEEFFRWCGRRHPNEMGVKVIGSLPYWVSRPKHCGNIQYPWY